MESKTFTVTLLGPKELYILHGYLPIYCFNMKYKEFT